MTASVGQTFLSGRVWPERNVARKKCGPDILVWPSVARKECDHKGVWPDRNMARQECLAHTFFCLTSIVFCASHTIPSTNSGAITVRNVRIVSPDGAMKRSDETASPYARSTITSIAASM